MDTFAALALATEPPSDGVLNRMPATKADMICNPVMWRNIIGQAILQIIILLTLLFKGNDIFGIKFVMSDPFYPTQEQIDAHPERTDWALQEPT